MTSINKYNFKDGKKELALFFGISVLSIIIFYSLFHSVLLASSLGVSVTKAGEIARMAYRAYKAGKSISEAVSVVTGPGAIVDIAVQILLGWGVSHVLGSHWLKAL
jgi:hypothetical protein